jgi:hypothetical protein
MEWNNDSCIGYMLYACDSLELDEELKKRLIWAIKDAFDFHTLYEAAKRYERN